MFFNTILCATVLVVLVIAAPNGYQKRTINQYTFVERLEIAKRHIHSKSCPTEIPLLLTATASGEDVFTQPAFDGMANGADKKLLIENFNVDAPEAFETLRKDGAFGYVESDPTKKPRQVILKYNSTP